MIELAMVFVGGMLGSAHCVGMCGGFALSIGTSAPGWSANLLRQGFYTCGRVATYTLGGMLTGYAGWRLNRAFPAAIPTQALLAIVAGTLLIVQGLLATGLLGRLPRAGATVPCLLPPLLRSYLTSRRPRDLFLAGVFTGFLPCGLVYAFLALASASGTMWQGGLRMALFGLGTAPLMVLTGWGGSLLRMSLRRHAFRIAGACIALTGALSIARGVQAFISTQDAICPFCR
jgi:hypothetical protein